MFYVYGEVRRYFGTRVLQEWVGSHFSIICGIRLPNFYIFVCMQFQFLWPSNVSDGQMLSIIGQVSPAASISEGM